MDILSRATLDLLRRPEVHAAITAVLQGADRIVVPSANQTLVITRL